MTLPPPAGYVRLVLPGTVAVVLQSEAATVQRALARGPLHALASTVPIRHTYQGRVPTYSVPLSALAGDDWSIEKGNGGGSEKGDGRSVEKGDGRSSEKGDGWSSENVHRVVVRHSHHGGLFAPLTRDLFLAPTRAPHELAISSQLRASGVPTPEIVAYAVYHVAPGIRRADVVTREVPAATDLAAFLRGAITTATDTRQPFSAVAELLDTLARANAHHPDLNIKNILLSATATGQLTAWVLDVDRVRFSPHAATRNLARLRRSLAKWRAATGLTDSHVDAFLSGSPL